MISLVREAMLRVSEYYAEEPEKRSWKDSPRWIRRSTRELCVLSAAFLGFPKLEKPFAVVDTRRYHSH